MKKISASDLIKWNGVRTVLKEMIEHYEKKPHLTEQEAKLLSDITVTFNNYESSSEEPSYEEEYV